MRDLAVAVGSSPTSTCKWPPKMAFGVMGTSSLWATVCTDPSLDPPAPQGEKLAALLCPRLGFLPRSRPSTLASTSGYLTGDFMRPRASVLAPRCVLPGTPGVLGYFRSPWGRTMRVSSLTRRRSQIRVIYCASVRLRLPRRSSSRRARWHTFAATSAAHSCCGT